MKEREKNVQKIKNDIFSLTEDYEPGDQVVYLDSLVSRISQESGKSSNNRPNRYGTVYSEPNVLDAPAANPDYSYDIELTYNENEIDPYYHQGATVSPIDCKIPILTYDNIRVFHLKHYE